MRNLIDIYVVADPATALGKLSAMPLMDLIVEAGIHEAIARKLNRKGQLSRNAIAEGIINNVRTTIVREQRTDPKFYAQMSQLLEDLIRQSRADAAAYERFLENAEALVKRLAQKDVVTDVPAALHGRPEAIVLFNNLPDILTLSAEERAQLALRIDQTMREHAPAGWKGDEIREKEVLNALFPVMSRDRKATEAIFQIIKNQAGY